MSCMSAYSMPLWTILTQWPAPTRADQPATRRPPPPGRRSWSGPARPARRPPLTTGHDAGAPQRPLLAPRHPAPKTAGPGRPWPARGGRCPRASCCRRRPAGRPPPGGRPAPPAPTSTGGPALTMTPRMRGPGQGGHKLLGREGPHQLALVAVALQQLPGPAPGPVVHRHRDPLPARYGPGSPPWWPGRSRPAHTLNHQGLLHLDVRLPCRHATGTMSGHLPRPRNHPRPSRSWTASGAFRCRSPGARSPTCWRTRSRCPTGWCWSTPGWNAPEALAALSEGLAVAGLGWPSAVSWSPTSTPTTRPGGRDPGAVGRLGRPADDAALVPDRYRDVDDLLERTSRWVAQTGAPGRRPGRAARRQRWPCAAGRRAAGPPAGRRGPAEVPGWRLRALHAVSTPRDTSASSGSGPGWCSPATTSCRPSANVSRHPQAGPDPLADYLASLERLRPYGDALVPPATSGASGAWPDA